MTIIPFTQARLSHLQARCTRLSKRLDQMKRDGRQDRLLLARDKLREWLARSPEVVKRMEEANGR